MSVLKWWTIMVGPNRINMNPVELKYSFMISLNKFTGSSERNKRHKCLTI